MTLLLGVDGCPGGWCAVALEVGDGQPRLAGARVYRSLAEILASGAAAPGRSHRWQLLRGVIPTLPDSPPTGRALAAGCAPDDYIDALACAWTAACVAAGTATRIPEQPETDDRGLRMEMCFPAEPANV